MENLNTSTETTQTTEPAIAVEPVLAPVIVKPIHAKATAIKGTSTYFMIYEIRINE